MTSKDDEALMDVETMVFVRWVDARSEDGWSTHDDLDHELARITTIGHLVKETDELLCIAASKDWRTGQLSGIMYIPKVCIKERGRLQQGTGIVGA